MTSRVVNCRSQLVGPPTTPPPPTPAPPPRPPHRGLKLTALFAMLLVPLAGAAEPPQGWLVALATALVTLGLALVVGPRVRWGWLSVLTATAAIVLPRGQMAVIGPALFVATGLCLVLWLANHEPRQPGTQRPPLGSREREAQQAMGVSGERRVSEWLARELPEDYVLINGLKLPRGTGDVDHVVVGPTGVFLLETKTMAGQIICEADGTWKRTRTGRGGTTYSAYIGDPAAQVLRNIFAARNSLRARAPQLFGRTPLWVEGMVVFPHPRSELLVEHSRIPAMRLEDAAGHICLHVPRRPLQPDEVEDVVDALLVEGNERMPERPLAAQSAQALVEAALAVPVVLILLFGTLALSRLVQAQTAVVTVAHEAARAGALGSGPADAIQRMRSRADLVAGGLGLDPGAIVLAWDVSTFASQQGRVTASVRYTLDFTDLPLAGWVPATSVRAEHVEWVDPFRSGITPIEDVSP